MSRYRRQSWKRLSLFISLTLVITLGLTGISFGAWNDSLSMGVTVDTAGFDPLIEVYKIVRYRDTFWGVDTETFECFSPVRPDANSLLTVRIGRSSDDPVPSWYIPFRNDKYKIYYRVINNSSIPLTYCADYSENVTAEQLNYVSLSPTTWTAIGTNATTEDNYINLDIKYQQEIKVLGNIIQAEINPFNLPYLPQLPLPEDLHLNQTIAKVRIKQFNTTTDELGWSKSFYIRVFTCDLF